ncbi:MAG TPA: hypothetical protein VJ824_01350 [Bacillota bacterium]|nr:hypothetical protein [Bacillota bacterium]
MFLFLAQKDHSFHMLIGKGVSALYTNPSFWISIIGALKLVAQGFGLQIPDDLTNEIANGFAALLTVYGIITNHDK